MTITRLTGELKDSQAKLAATAEADTQAKKVLEDKIAGLEGRLTSAEFDLGKLKAFNLKKTEEDVAALQDKLKDVDFR